MYKLRNKFIVLKVNGQVEDIAYESLSDIGIGKEGLEAEYKKEWDYLTCSTWQSRSSEYKG